MANAGKFVDRSPAIRTAGLPSVVDSDHELLKEYHPSELLRAQHFWKCKWNMQQRPKDVYVREPVYDTITDCMSWDLGKSRFIEFLEKFYEELFSKQAPLGQVRSLKTKPDEVTNCNTLFGKVSDESEPLYDLIMPPRSAAEVLKEYYDHHDWHIISHNAYFPSEQIRRNYNKNFDPNKTMGMTGKVYWDGRRTKMALEECPHRTFITRVQHDFYKRTHPEVGKNRFRFKYTVPLDATYGIKSGYDQCNVGALLEEREPCEKDWKNLGAVAYINLLREKLQETRFFDFNLFFFHLKNLDEKKTGVLPVSKLYTALGEQLISINKRIMMNVLMYFKLIEGETPEGEALVKWKRFWRLLNIHRNLPEVDTLYKVPENIDNKDTTYRNLCKDLQKPIKECLPRKPSFKEDIETVQMCVSPDIPAQYFLEPKDFRKPLSKEVLQRIFSRLIPENFDEIWDAAKETFKPDNDLLSVSQVRQAYGVIRDARKKQKEDFL